jgi:hypothetical protein
LRVGAELEPIGIYLASPNKFDLEQVKNWKAAYDAMCKDGSYACILRKYRYAPPK